MKLVFIEARKKQDTEKIKENTILKKSLKKLAKLKGGLHIFYSIQYKDLANTLAHKLKSLRKNIHITQILGCSKPKLKATNTILVGSGKFHTLPLLSGSKNIYIFYPNYNLRKLKQDKNLDKIKQAKLAKYYSSDKIGIIVSIKPGQYNLEKALNFKSRQDKLGNKKTYIFFSDTLNLNELENFNIDFWINTACPHLTLDSNKILNISDLKE